MKDYEVTALLKEAAGEIRMLRAINAEAGRDAQAYGVIAKIVGMIPSRSVTMGEDVAWKLDQAIDALQKPKEEDQP